MAFVQVSTRKTLGIFWQHARHYPKALGLAITALTLGAATSLAYPTVLRHFFEDLSKPDGTTKGALLALLGWIAGVLALEWICWRLATYAIAFLENSVMCDLDETCFEALHSHSYRFFTGNFVGSLVKKVNRFSRAFETIADRLLFNVVTLSVRLVGAFFMLFWLDATLSLILCVWLALYLALVFGMTLYKLRFDIESAAADSRVTAVLADSITNATTIKVFAGLEREQERFAEARRHQKATWMRSWFFSGHIDAAQNCLTVLLELAILGWGVVLWDRGQLSIGDFAMIQNLLLILVSRLFEVSRVIKEIYRALADAEEMIEVFETPIEVVDAPEARTLVTHGAAIHFEDLNFNYGSETLFRGLDLSIAAGEKVALIGPSGSGKSSLTRLILRFFDLQGGRVLIDDQDIAKVTQDSLRRAIGYVPQEPLLFHRSLLENIRYGRPEASEEEVLDAARRARCHDFIVRLPLGYDTLVGERGVKLSGGERQRVAIARAILEDAPILILDEATSSLDSESEHLIQEALDELMKGRTTLVIAHRLSTIMSMDRIVVMRQGSIVEEGSHDELVAREGSLYGHLWHLQAGGFIPDSLALPAMS